MTDVLCLFRFKCEISSETPCARELKLELKSSLEALIEIALFYAFFLIFFHKLSLSFPLSVSFLTPSLYFPFSSSLSFSLSLPQFPFLSLLISELHTVRRGLMIIDRARCRSTAGMWWVSQARLRFT